MRKRVTTSELSNKRLLSWDECQRYIGLGRNSSRKFCEDIQAVRHYGRRILFDKFIIDAHLDELK